MQHDCRLHSHCTFYLAMIKCPHTNILMTTTRHQRFTKLATLFLLLAFALFCRGGGLSFNLLHDGSMPSHDRTNMPPCCDIESPISNAMHITTVLPLSARDIFKLIFGLLAVFFVSRIKHFSYKRRDKLLFYWKDIRLRHGSTKLFEYFSTLFRLGLLHPKTW